MKYTTDWTKNYIKKTNVGNNKFRNYDLFIFFLFAIVFVFVFTFVSNPPNFYFVL